jgi:hypothetical protein
MGGACGMYGGQEMHTRFLMGRPDRKRHFGRPGRVWDVNIKISIQELGGGSWTRLLLLRIGKV